VSGVTACRHGLFAGDLIVDVLGITVEDFWGGRDEGHGGLDIDGNGAYCCFFIGDFSGDDSIDAKLRLFCGVFSGEESESTKRLFGLQEIILSW